MAGSDGELLHLHHLGFVVASINATANSMARSLNGSWGGQVFHDPIQKVAVTFLSSPGTDVQIELIEPGAGDSPVRAFLNKGGGGLHHLCYEVANCDEMLVVMRQRRARIVRRPRPAVAFNGSRIAWVLTAENLLLEFLERQAPPAQNAV